MAYLQSCLFLRFTLEHSAQEAWADWTPGFTRTTTSLTTSWSHAIAQALSLSPDNETVEYLIRATFFGLNLLFNLAMWTLFTAALTRASSTTRVSIINTSANFFATAMLGLIIFGEQLPPMWWAGAGLLAAGNVIIGRREEGEKSGGPVSRERDDEEEQVLLGEDIRGGNAMGLGEELGGAETTKEALQKGEEVDSPIRW
jgi:drug/metabolite transporter (DMT)-like permease